MAEALSILGITLKPHSGGTLSHAQFAEYASDADVLIYADGNYESVMGNSTVAAILSGMPAIKNERVFDVQGLGLTDFHTGRPSAHDVFVEDLATVIFTTTNDDFEITGLQHDPVFLRNVYTDPIGATPACSGDYAPVLANACVPTEFVAQWEQQLEDLEEFLSGAGGTRAGLLVATAAAAVAVLLL
jgi:hypothetical protein